MTFTATFRVRWVDTDVAGVMHYTNFLRYFEACEQEFYRSLGSELNKIRERYHIMLPRIEAHCHYKAPCRYDDLVEVKLEVTELTDKTITYGFRLIRKRDRKLAAHGSLKCIAVNSRWKVVRLPKELVKRIHETRP